MSFPLKKIKLVPLFMDAVELESAKARSQTIFSLTKVSQAYHDLYFPAPSDERPYTFASIVLSMDGKMAFPDNPQGPVVASANAIDREGGLTDFWILNVLRAHADAIIVGANTLKVEPEAVFACFDPDLIEERKTNLGKTREIPITVIVSLDGKDIPFEHSIFNNPGIQTIIATSHQGGLFLQKTYGEDTLLIGPYENTSEIDKSKILDLIAQGKRGNKKIIIMTGENRPDSTLLLHALRKIGIDHLLIESPTYMWILMREQLLDEFFINYSTLFIGGPITPGYANGFSYRDHPHTKFLVVAMHQNSFLFTRQKLVYNLPVEN